MDDFNRRRRQMEDDFDRETRQMRLTFILCAVGMFLIFFFCVLCGFLYRRRMNHRMFLRSQQQAASDTGLQYHPPPESLEVCKSIPPINQSQTSMHPYAGLNSDVQNAATASAPQMHDLPDAPPPYESIIKDF